MPAIGRRGDYNSLHESVSPPALARRVGAPRRSRRKRPGLVAIAVAAGRTGHVETMEASFHHHGRRRSEGTGGDTGARESLRRRIAVAQRHPAPRNRRRVSGGIQRRNLGIPGRIPHVRARARSARRRQIADRGRIHVRRVPHLRVPEKRQDHPRRHRRNGASAVSDQSDRRLAVRPRPWRIGVRSTPMRFRSRCRRARLRACLATTTA